ncbi:MAG: adenylate/guanylate cyclase domain-containing protein [Chloroflexi bacterium]|uniref:adenylate/guanylate cyclase domain-containing protein n=1 Tax=Candidatus Flexifilum breve TaxID=3140694 RepID=UPI003135A4F0|nr:adenylate/guanylate cyclase domain-containing protein [Chloroflexota bacterium]
MTTQLQTTTLAARLNAVKDLGKFSAQVMNDFASYLTTAPDEDLFRVSPYYYARRTGTSVREATDLFLYATHFGILEFNWGVLCPSCHAFVTSPGGLRAIQNQEYCNHCMIGFDVSVDDNIEVAFTVAPSTRSIRFHDMELLDFQRDWLLWFYTHSMYHAPEIRQIAVKLMVTSDKIGVDARRTVEVDLVDGANYFVTTPDIHAFANRGTDPNAASDITFDLFDGRIVPEGAYVKPGKVKITFRNRIGKESVYGVIYDPRHGIPNLNDEESAQLTAHFSQPMEFLTGKQVATSQVFRELFRAESIPSDLGLAFKSVTFLFTDLKGSTALYQRVGDIRAYEIVRKHFTLLRDIIAECGGAVVKTMGDAVMATFSEPLTALQAAFVINQQIGKIGDDHECLIIKIGIHMGPCIAVENSERLDYFGQTVNLAARVQAVAEAGELVITDPVYSYPGAQELIVEAKLTSKTDSVLLRGIDGETQVYRLM